MFPQVTLVHTKLEEKNIKVERKKKEKRNRKPTLLLKSSCVLWIRIVNEEGRRWCFKMGFFSLFFWNMFESNASMSPWQNGFVVQCFNANNPLEQTKQMANQRQNRFEIERQSTLVIEKHTFSTLLSQPLAWDFGGNLTETSVSWSHNFVDNISS